MSCKCMRLPVHVSAHASHTWCAGFDKVNTIKSKQERDVICKLTGWQQAGGGAMLRRRGVGSESDCKKKSKGP